MRVVDDMTAGMDTGIRFRGVALVVSGVSALLPPLAYAVPDAVLARAYPVKAVRLIVAVPPGGPGDTVARMIGPRLTDAWAQPVVVDNRPGASGIIGIEMTARAAPDAYTIAMVSSSLVTNPSLHKRVPYDPVRDFAPVTQAVSVPSVLAAHPGFAPSSVAELVAAARVKPGSITFSSAGRGTSGHLALELFQSLTGARFAHTPFKGGAPALTELLNGQVNATFGIAVTAIPQMRAGKLRALAVTSAIRTRVAPDIVTIAESGYPEFELTTWFGVIVPAATPAVLVNKLHAEIVRILRHPDTEQRLLAQAAEPVASSPKEFAAHIGAEMRRWTRFIKQAGIRAD